MKKCLNPFVYVSGERSLAYGLAVTILTAILAWQCDVLTNGALSLGYGHELLWKAFARLLAVWAVGAVLLYAAALLLSKSKIRAIDVFGMNLLARSLPFAVMVLLTAWMAPVLMPLQETMLAQGISADEMVETVRSFRVLAGGFLSIVCFVWYVVWTYEAYALAANLKGWRAVASFAVCFLAADLASRYLVALL